MLMRESQKIIFAASVLNHDGHWYAKFGCPASMLPPKKIGSCVLPPIFC